MDPRTAAYHVAYTWALDDISSAQGVDDTRVEAALHEVAHAVVAGIPIPLRHQLTRDPGMPVQRYIGDALHVIYPTFHELDQNEVETLAVQLLAMQELGIVHSPKDWLNENAERLEILRLHQRVYGALRYPRVQRAARNVLRRMRCYAKRLKEVSGQKSLA